MAKKKAKTRVAKRVAKPAAKTLSPKPEPAPTIVVLYELSGVASVRYHSEYSDLQRARITAQTLVTSPDVSQAWILQNVEIFRSRVG